MNLDKGLPLAERLQRIDHIQARRFSKLSGPPMEIATEGIVRHLTACDRYGILAGRSERDIRCMGSEVCRG